MSSLRTLCDVCWSYLPHSPALPQLIPLSCPFNFMSFLFLILQDQLAWPKYSLMRSLPLESGQFTKGHTLGENCLWLCQQLTIANSSRTRCGMAPLRAGIWSGLRLHKFCTCCKKKNVVSSCAQLPWHVQKIMCLCGHPSLLVFTLCLSPLSMIPSFTC